MGVYFERYVRVHRARVSNEEYNRNVILRTEVPTVEGTLRPFTDWPIRDISRHAGAVQGGPTGQ